MHNSIKLELSCQGGYTASWQSAIGCHWAVCADHFCGVSSTISSVWLLSVSWMKAVRESLHPSLTLIHWYLNAYYALHYAKSECIPIHYPCAMKNMPNTSLIKLLAPLLAHTSKLFTIIYKIFYFDHTIVSIGKNLKWNGSFLSVWHLQHKMSQIIVVHVRIFGRWQGKIVCVWTNSVAIQN